MDRKILSVDSKNIDISTFLRYLPTFLIKICNFLKYELKRYVTPQQLFFDEIRGHVDKQYRNP